MDPHVARRLWTLYEPVHAVTYFAPEVTTAWSAAGVTGFWRGYFAGRAAPLAPSGPEVVTATFFGFAPGMVARAIPSIWSLVAPERALEVRVDGAVAALDAALGPATPDEEEAATLLRAGAEAATDAGRALAAANAAAPWPSGVRAELWHAATVLREHRGDGHVAACVAADLTGLEANVLAVAAGPLSAERFQQIRGWTPEEWDAARAGLVDRGLVAADGAPTAAGADLRASIEAATDRSALRPWRALGADAVARLDAALAPVVARLHATDVIPDPNPIGVPRA
jgi:hypothetical protein